MAKINSFKIVEEKNIIHDHLLDIIGAEFRFDHAKGIAEWLKNSMDAYRRFDVPDAEQYVVYRFKDGEKDDASIECIDFVGMTEEDIIQAFKVWGDPEAAKRGLKKRMYGGHGNGGKFYMRQMFDHSFFITYRNGYLNIFGFNEKQKYGFADGYKNDKIKPEEALRLANIDSIIFPSDVKKKILKSKTGFTVVKGLAPSGMKNKIKVNKIIEKFRNHPQARRILARANVSVIHNDKYVYDFLRSEEVPSMKGFEEPKIIPIPEKLNLKEGESTEIKLAIPPKFSIGKLTLRTSEEALSGGGRLGDLNRIDFLGEIGVIASYQMSEFGVTAFPQANFIYGECECPILENSEEDCVKNDRTKLVENDLTRTLLAWVADQVDQLAAEISKKEQKERSEQEKKLSSAYNEVLNRWKDKFMKKVFSEIFGGGGNLSIEDGGTGVLRKKLIAPENGLEFTFGATDIPINEVWQLTLKASTPKPIPFGSIINLKSSNSAIELEENKIVVKADFVKLTEKGETVAVININVAGKRIGEEGEVIAYAGKYSDKMMIKVVETKGGGGGKKSRYPKVLLSGYDSDPLGIAQEGKVFLSGRDPLVYQRPQDIVHGIYWINTSSPMADAILNREIGGVESTRWRDFLFQRYVDIFVKEGLHELQKKDPENFRADVIESRIMDDLIRKIHSAATNDLNELLFGQSYVPPDPNKK